MARRQEGGYITNGQIVGVGYNTKLYSNAFGIAGANMSSGLSWTPTELFGATFDPGVPTTGSTKNHPAYYSDSSGRPPRVNQWNISLQRSILNDLTVEAAYVGNRGVWLQSDNMLNLNALTLEDIRRAGFDLGNATDRSILTGTWTSPAAQARGIKAPYPSFPTNQTAINALRPFPQFSTITPRWASFGNSWYDALHVKVTKRYSHGLDMSASFSWQKSMFIGDTRGGAVNDIFNRQQNKYLSSQDVPADDNDRVYVCDAGSHE